MSPSIHLPGLNGLRAIAALTVMWGHVFLGPFGYWGLEGDYRSIFPLGGVTLFFVISGFLITYLLLNERDNSGTINVKKFYIRRILRIWPLYYVYLSIALLFTGVSIGNGVWFYLFFGANIPFILGSALWPIVHYWSLGVEEQFYLFWPWIVKKIRIETERGYRILTYDTINNNHLDFMQTIMLDTRRQKCPLPLFLRYTFRLHDDWSAWSSIILSSYILVSLYNT